MFSDCVNVECGLKHLGVMVSNSPWLDMSAGACLAQRPRHVVFDLGSDLFVVHCFKQADTSVLAAVFENLQFQFHSIGVVDALLICGMLNTAWAALFWTASALVRGVYK